MRLLDPRRLHESHNVVRENLRGVSALGFVCFSGPAQVDRDAGKVFGVLGHLERVTRVIRSQVRKKKQWLSAPLLFIIHREVVGLDFGHGVSFRSLWWSAVAAHISERTLANPLFSGCGSSCR